MKKMIIGGLVAGGLILGAASPVLGAGVANANPGGNYEYLWLVHDDNDDADVIWRGDAWLLNEGWASCSAMRAGYSHSAVMAGVRVDGALPYSTHSDVDIVAAATTALCPDQRLAAPPPPPRPLLSPAY
jgi:hypothetical protein